VTADQPRHRIPVPPVPALVGWQYRAACRGTDLNVFFPERGKSAEPARQICASCPVRQPCLEFALRYGITHGIWGGLAERDRRDLRTRQAAAARQERDTAIAAASTAGYTKAAIGRAFGLAAPSVSRVLARDAQRRGRS